MKSREGDPAEWAKKVEIISGILAEHKPRAIFFPHEHDWNCTHIGVHFLVMDALRQTSGIDCYLLETEFWGQMDSPNLMVEYGRESRWRLGGGDFFSYWRGKTKSVPCDYSVLDADNRASRRGTGGAGRRGGWQFMFAQLFRLQCLQNGKVESCQRGRAFSGGV